MTKLKSKADILFELSWEVCNKVGGIYTVVMSKAALMKKHCKNYILVGPLQEKSKYDFEAQKPPEEIRQSFEELAAEGIKCQYGVWKIKGEPTVILIDFYELVNKKDSIKSEMWEKYQIDSMNVGWDFEEPMLWSYAAGKMIESITKKYPWQKASVHCHEWMAGFALLYLKSKKVKTGAVFTTHATMLGRSLAGNNVDLYSQLEHLDPQHEAHRLNVESKFLTERACAHTADIFTTVSEITSIEAEKLLGRKADVLVLNGLDIGKFPTIEETSIKHVTVRDKIREFLSYYFFPYYYFDLSHNLVYFIVGRYEFRNKGLDILIRALGKLNQRLKEEDSKRTISVFLWIPAGQSGIRTEILENKNFFRHIKNFVEYHSEDIIKKVVSNIINQKKLTITNIFEEEFLHQLKKDSLNFKREGDPPLSTHYMDEKNDAMVQALRENGLNNKEEDKVKAIIYPVYLDGADEMINLSYYDTIAGCHLGLFPSYYEPWGYTPLEGAALGVASLTTDLAGFGRFIQKHEKKKEGIFVLKRMDRSEEEQIDDFTDIMYHYAKLNRYQRVHNKTVAKSLAAYADWSILIENYIEAHNRAVDKVFGAQTKDETHSE